MASVGKGNDKVDIPTQHMPALKYKVEIAKGVTKYRHLDLDASIEI